MKRTGHNVYGKNRIYEIKIGRTEHMWKEEEKISDGKNIEHKEWDEQSILDGKKRT